MMTATTGESEQISLSHRCLSCLQRGALHARQNFVGLGMPCL